MMRTSANALDKFREMVNSRGASLREMPFAQLKDSTAFEELTVDSRRATIATIVLPLGSGGIQVVVQGFMDTRLVGKHVALDGFYKYPDETIAPMSAEDFYDFD
jgi:hypothetical protein